MKDTYVIEGCYKDSVILMKVAENIQHTKGVREVVVVMGTHANKIILDELGMLNNRAEKATSNDLIIGIEAERKSIIDEILKDIDKFLPELSDQNETDTGYASLKNAIEGIPGLNMALISVPGEFASIVAKEALDSDLNTLIFSDNVPISEEIELKKISNKKGLFVMGPGCGGAVINGASLGLMSAVSDGKIGIVAASGSGMQEIAAQLDKLNLGISQAIGTGGRDLSDDVGGITAIKGMEELDKDPNTNVIVLVSKLPGEKTKEKVLRFIEKISKPVILNFMSDEVSIGNLKNVVVCKTLEDTALRAADTLNNEVSVKLSFPDLKKDMFELAKLEKNSHKSKQRYFRGLFCGGTHCEEAFLIMRKYHNEIFSNINMPSINLLENSVKSKKNTLLDLGEEEFTIGRPHPVVDPTIFKNRLLQESEDEEVAVILMDIILGFGAHENPAGFLIETIRSIKAKNMNKGKNISIVASVCGTEKDPQRLSIQESILKEGGVLVFPSNARACLFASTILT